MNVTTPHGSASADYGSFGSASGAFDVEYGGQKWGNFLSLSGNNSGRFLDPPEFAVMHDRGNEENVFDRWDNRFSSADSLQVNLGFTRSWFETPNSYDSTFASAWNGLIVDGTPAATSNDCVDRGVRRSSRQQRSAFADSHIQRRSHLDASVRNEHGL